MTRHHYLNKILKLQEDLAANNSNIFNRMTNGFNYWGGDTTVIPDPYDPEWDGVEWDKAHDAERWLIANMGGALTPIGKGSRTKRYKVIRYNYLFQSKQGACIRYNVGFFFRTNEDAMYFKLSVDL